MDIWEQNKREIVMRIHLNNYHTHQQYEIKRLEELNKCSQIKDYERYYDCVDNL